MEQTYAQLTKDCKECQNWLASGSRSGIKSRDLVHEAIELDWFIKHSSTHKFSIGRKGNGKPQGAFAFTLTKSPSDDLSASDMVIAVRKIMSQKSIPVKRYAWAYEDKGDGKHPHIHGMYETETGGRIPTRHWKRAWDIWDEKKLMGQGFRGGYHRPVKDEESYQDYIGKDGGLSENKNITQEYNNNGALDADRTQEASHSSAAEENDSSSRSQAVQGTQGSGEEDHRSEGGNEVCS